MFHVFSSITIILEILLLIYICSTRHEEILLLWHFIFYFFINHILSNDITNFYFSYVYQLSNDMDNNYQLSILFSLNYMLLV